MKMYEIQMDPCGLYGNQVDDSGEQVMDFFSERK